MDFYWVELKSSRSRADLMTISQMLATLNQIVLVGFISSIWITTGNWSESNSASTRMWVSSRKKRGPIKFLLGTSVQSSLDGEYQIDQESWNVPFSVPRNFVAIALLSGQLGGQQIHPRTMRISSPPAARSTYRERWILASCIFTFCMCLCSLVLVTFG